MHFIPTVNKARKPKFELHLRIYDLNNVPLVSGVSQIKWNLPHSIHGEHRGRTDKCSIANHKVQYNYGRIVPLRIHIDRASNLEDCPIEFEVLQEFGAADDKIVLGKVTLNLSEYVEESEAILRERPMTSGGGGSTTIAAVSAAASAASAAVSDQYHHQASKLSFGHSRDRSSTSSVTAHQPARPASKDSGSGSGSGQQDDADATPAAPEVREGIIRRHLMQESKINSTLKIGILMIQIDGDRNFIAPPLRTAPVFGGIAGLSLTGEQVDQDDSSSGHAPISSLKNRDTSEMQDMYRTSLAASIASPPSPGELAPDECIEDIFGGGTGFTDPDMISYTDGSGGRPASSLARSGSGVSTNSRHHRRQRSAHFSTSSTLAPPSPSHGGSGGGAGDGSPSSAEETSGGNGGATLRPRDVRSFFSRSSAHTNGNEQGGGGSRGHYHRRQRSNASDKSSRTLIMTGTGGESTSRSKSRGPSYRDQEKDELYYDSRNAGDMSATSTGSSAARRMGGGGLVVGNHHSREASRGRSESMNSLATTASSDRDRGREGFRRAPEVDEFEVRDDLVAWRLPGKVS